MPQKAALFSQPRQVRSGRGLAGLPQASQKSSAHRGPLVIDAQKNISTKPSSGFHYEISTPAFLFFPKVKTDKDLGPEK